MRTAFEKSLKELQAELFDMAAMVNNAVERSVDALKNRDVEHAGQIKNDDIHINNMRWKIEEQCIQLIATQQPVATHLRQIIAVLNIITELERMGDHAEGIAKIVIKLNGESPVKPLIDIPRMAQISTEMISGSLHAFSERDIDKARKIILRDDEVDELYHQILRELISIMIEDPRTITRCTYLMWTAHNLERIADRVTNICERIIFLVTGEVKENIKRDK
ncbi:phosphate signaling complex protein PhoU [Natronogracilivirga saccharolytica]|uniref:Phosphate-specific transport system accessory protein PhoU n=1 Tax=Natronogracilivirga saccharolytica TaxID=2812953 RepID=A0A8J7UVT2_9BACT|nr:phosphate signaling complex protein PhoU [Natronogracilivirga saccharolytica]MBP3191499.1 phosphate signaling complex protein PhoU [Natronogracilivirga saccharolytica]